MKISDLGSRVSKGQNQVTWVRITQSTTLPFPCQWLWIFFLLRNFSHMIQEAGVAVRDYNRLTSPSLSLLQMTKAWGWQRDCYNVNEFLVSKETEVLRRWGRSKQKFGFIKRVDKTKFLLQRKSGRAFSDEYVSGHKCSPLTVSVCCRRRTFLTTVIRE